MFCEIPAVQTSVTDFTYVNNRIIILVQCVMFFAKVIRFYLYFLSS